MVILVYNILVLPRGVRDCRAIQSFNPAEKIIQDTPLSRPISYLKVQETTTSLLYDIWRDNGLI